MSRRGSGAHSKLSCKAANNFKIWNKGNQLLRHTPARSLTHSVWQQADTANSLNKTEASVTTRALNTIKNEAVLIAVLRGLSHLQQMELRRRPGKEGVHSGAIHIIQSAVTRQW